MKIMAIELVAGKLAALLLVTLLPLLVQSAITNGNRDQSLAKRALTFDAAGNPQAPEPPCPEDLTEESLRTYLKDVNDYFAIFGRPRFGG